MIPEDRGYAVERNFSGDDSGGGGRGGAQKSTEAGMGRGRRFLHVQEAALPGLGLRRALLPELLNLRIGPIQSHFLHQHGLRQQIERVRPRADGAPDQLIGIAIH